MNNRHPLLTIGMPVFNEEKFLEKAISSILSQTLTNFKLVIADNASTDRSWEIIESFAKKDSRIECFQHSRNIGAFKNFVFLFDKCSSEFFAWAGSHDYVHENCYRILVDRLQSDPTACLAYANTKIIDGCGNSLSVDDRVSQEYANPDPTERARQIIATLDWCHPFYGVYRSVILSKCRLFIPSIGPDHVVLMEVVLRGSIVFAQDAIYYRREYRTDGYEGAKYLRAQLERSLGVSPLESTIDIAYFEWWYQHLVSAWKVEGSLFERLKRTIKVSRSFTGRWQSFIGGRWERFRFLIKRVLQNQ